MVEASVLLITRVSILLIARDDFCGNKILAFLPAAMHSRKIHFLTRAKDNAICFTRFKCTYLVTKGFVKTKIAVSYSMRCKQRRQNKFVNANRDGLFLLRVKYTSSSLEYFLFGVWLVVMS